MKKFTLLFVAIFSFASIQAQEVSTDQWTYVTKTSATWCGNCGTWGWDLLENLIEDNEDKNVIIWSSHNSGDLDNEASLAINQALGSAGQPQFFVNNDNFPVNSGNTATMRGEMNAYIDALVSFAPLAGVGVESSYEDGVLQVTGKAEFFSGLDVGNFHLAFYLVKNNLVHNQANNSSQAIHKYVLTDMVSEEAFGEQIAEGPIEPNATYTITASKEIEGVDLENDEVVAILWNLRSDGVYAFFNANRSDVSLMSATTDIEGINDITTVQNMGELLINIESETITGMIQSRLLSVTGQQVASQSITSTIGQNQIRYNTASLTSGTYLVQLVIDGEVHTEKVVVN